MYWLTDFYYLASNDSDVSAERNLLPKIKQNITTKLIYSLLYQVEMKQHNIIIGSPILPSMEAYLGHAEKEKEIKKNQIKIKLKCFLFLHGLRHTNMLRHQK